MSPGLCYSYTQSITSTNYYIVYGRFESFDCKSQREQLFCDGRSNIMKSWSAWHCTPELWLVLGA